MKKVLKEINETQSEQGMINYFWREFTRDYEQK